MEGRIIRKIQIAPTKTLYNFAKVITQAFTDVGEKMIFLFDYGDGWQFNVELLEIHNGQKGDLKPVILESIGKAPLQYPPCEEEVDNN